MQQHDLRDITPEQDTSAADRPSGAPPPSAKDRWPSNSCTNTSGWRGIGITSAEQPPSRRSARQPDPVTAPTFCDAALVSCAVDSA